MKKVLIYGSRDFGKVVRNIMEQTDHEFAGFIDDFYSGEEVVGTYEEVKEKYQPHAYQIVVATGYKKLEARWDIYKKVIRDNYKVPTLIHPNAFVSGVKNIGQGSIIMVGAVVDHNARLGELTVAWPGVVVNHDSFIGHNTFLSPGAIVCGSVNIGPMSFIGAGSVIVDHVDVPEKSFVKAGSVFSKTA